MRRTTLSLALLFVCGCGAASTAGGPPAAATSAAPAAVSPVALSCTAAGDASPSWPSAQAASGTAPGIVSAVTSGDTLVLTFAAGTPQFRVVPQSSAKFAIDPSGRPVTLAGSAGVKIALLGFRGDVSNYSATSPMSSSGPLLLQASGIGDFEGIVTFAAGVSRSACANVSAGSSTLTFTFIPAPAGA